MKNFNSIKVRLEHNETSPTTLMLEFQFHKGAIRTVDQLQDQTDLNDFNSIKVRLERL